MLVIQLENFPSKYDKVNERTLKWSRMKRRVLAVS